MLKKYEPIIVSVLLIASLVLINVLATEYYFRIDLTRDKEYTLSPAFAKIITSVGDRVIIKAYFTEDLPFYFAGLKRRVRDFLEEVRILSRGNINYEFIDPSANSDLQSQANSSGVPEIQVNAIEQDKAEIKKVYFGLAMHYEDRKEAIPVVKEIEGLEYDFAVALMRLVKREKPVVGLITGMEPGEVRYEDMQGVVEELGKTYTIRWSPPEKAIDPDVKTLIVIKHRGLTETTLRAIDQFIMNGATRGGGTCLFFASGMDGPPANIFASSSNNPLLNLLRHYGITVNNNYVVDRSCVPVSFNAGYFSVSVPYPFYVKVIPDFEGKPWGFNKSIASVTALESLVLPWVSTVTSVDTSVQAEPMIYASPYSDAMNGFVNLNYQQQFDLEYKNDTLVLGVIRRGPLTSSYGTESIEKSNIIVIGTDHMLSDRMMSSYPENFFFLHNVIDQFTLGEELIAIRSKQIQNRPIRELVESRKTAVKFAAIIGVPLTVIILGAIRYVLRRKKVRRNSV